jgi:hypothetical protein
MPEPQTIPPTAAPPPNHPGAPPPPLPEGKRTAPTAPATGTETVTVACKVPNGLILRVYDKVDGEEPIYGGGSKRIDQFYQTGESIVLRGSSLDPIDLKSGNLPLYPHVGGFALTAGVPKAFWEKWKEQNADHPVLKNNLVFAADGTDKASGEARDKVDVKSGMEGIDQDDPGKRTGLRAIVKGERK